MDEPKDTDSDGAGNYRICPNCPQAVVDDDPDKPLITLQQKHAADTCNKWSKLCKIEVGLKVGWFVYLSLFDYFNVVPSDHLQFTCLLYKY